MAEAKNKSAKQAEELKLDEQEQAIDTQEQASDVKEEKSTAKAGKRSAKAIKEAEEKQAKEERKAEKTDGDKQEQPKAVQKPARSRLERRGKNYRKLAEQIEKGKVYNLKEGAELAVKTNPAKFDASVELHVRLNVDPKQADQNIRATVALPAGTGKTMKTAVFAAPEDAEKAKQAGAEIAGEDEVTTLLDKSNLDFDILIATPAMMPKLGKYARVLGPKGLMPNPKSGTVATDVAKAVKEAKAGRVEFRVDSTGIIHVAAGKVSFGAEKVMENLNAILGAIKSNKPSSIKGNYVRSIYVTTSMGPSIVIDNNEAN